MRSKAIFVLLVLVCICPFAIASEEAVEGQEQALSPFSGNVIDSLLTVISFVLLLTVLWKLAWKPMLAGLNARQDHIEMQISDAEKLKKQAQKTLNDYTAKIDNIEHDGKRIIDTHTKKAEKECKELIAKAQKDISVIKLKAEADLERQRSEAHAELWVQAGQIVLKLGEDVLSKTLDDEDNQRLIEQAIERLSNEENKNKESGK